MVTAKPTKRHILKLIIRRQWLILQGRALTWLYDRGYIIKVKR